MAALDDVDQLIEQYHPALEEFSKGNPEPVKKPTNYFCGEANLLTGRSADKLQVDTLG